MLGHRSSANLLATSLPHCVKTTLLLFLYPTPERKINWTHLSPHYLAEVKKSKVLQFASFPRFGTFVMSVG